MSEMKLDLLNKIRSAPQSKIDVIDKITKFHPGYGTESGYSWYVGGMRDTGDWNIDIMLEADEAALRSFLLILERQDVESKEANNKRIAEYERVKKLPKEEQDEYYRKQEQEVKEEFRKLGEKLEHAMMWGNKK